MVKEGEGRGLEVKKRLRDTKAEVYFFLSVPRKKKKNKELKKEGVPLYTIAVVRRKSANSRAVPTYMSSSARHHSDNSNNTQ